MVEREDKIESKKEYTTPQMEVMALEVVKFLCGSNEGEVCVEGSEGC